MFGREQLKRYTVKKWLHSEWEINPDENGEFFWVDDVNPVLNKMEARIKELEFAYESHVNDMYLLEARIKELEAENKKLEDDWQKSYAEECVTRHENHNLVDRIEELETKLAKEKAYSHSLREELSNYNELYKH